MADIHDVAKRAGVSTATVSRSFGPDGRVNAETRKRVLEAAKALDYAPRGWRPEGARVRQRTAATDAIGFQFFAAEPLDSLLSNAFYAPVLAGAQSEAAALGLNLLLHTTDRHALAQEMPKMVVEHAVSGLLLVGAADPEVVARFAEHVPCLTLLDNREPTGAYDCVFTDGFGGGGQAARYLLAQGHRRIGFFLAEPDVPTFRERLHGYVCALFEAGIPLDPAWIFAYPDARRADRAAQLAATLKAATPAQRPTALLAANDHYALAAQRALRQAGLRVPDDISIIGFDDSEHALHSDPPLTTIHVDKEALGRRAVRCVHRRMTAMAAGQPPPAPERHEVPVTLVVRGSSCRAPE